jgi:signal transduction histidine kinase
LFTPFFRSKDLQNIGKNRNSYGLGLNICSKIITAMGGTLGVKSELGVGSTFFVKVKAEIDKDERDKLRVS